MDLRRQHAGTALRIALASRHLITRHSTSYLDNDEFVQASAMQAAVTAVRRRPHKTCPGAVLGLLSCWSNCSIAPGKTVVTWHVGGESADQHGVPRCKGLVHVRHLVGALPQPLRPQDLQEVCRVPGKTHAQVMAERMPAAPELLLPELLHILLFLLALPAQPHCTQHKPGCMTAHLHAQAGRPAG